MVSACVSLPSGAIADVNFWVAWAMPTVILSELVCQDLQLIHESFPNVSVEANMVCSSTLPPVHGTAAASSRRTLREDKPSSAALLRDFNMVFTKTSEDIPLPLHGTRMDIHLKEDARPARVTAP